MSISSEARLRLESNSSEETARMGEACAAALTAGDVVALTGELGSGKTVFTKGLLRGLGLRDASAAASPTFALLNIFDLRLRVYHFDAYRLKGAREFMDIDAPALMDSSGVSIIEWADRVRAALPPRAVWIEFSHSGESRRGIEIADAAGRPGAIIAALERRGRRNYGET